ncbi:MAG: hypothetical protein JXQ73_25145 [Phycisphaerae bacterium]|nr:hypothetical protein [Phycisphaerae bacterium]
MSVDVSYNLTTLLVAANPDGPVDFKLVNRIVEQVLPIDAEDLGQALPL